MPENATDLHERFAAHFFKHEQERIAQRWRIRWRQFVSLFFANGIIALSALVFLTGCEKPIPPKPIRPVRALKLEAEQRIHLHSFPGRTRAVGRTNLSFRVEGPLIEKPVHVGDDVEKGKILARIDPRDFQVAVEEAQGNLEQANAKLRFAESDYARAISLYEKDPGAISVNVLDQKKEEVGRLEGEIQSLQAQLYSAQDALSYTYLLAPYKGMVVATYVENYEYVKAKQPIMRLLNNSQIEMVIDVPETLIAEIPYVERINVKFDVYPNREFPAHVKEISTEASMTTRTYPVTLVIDQPEDVDVFAGMAGEAVLESQQMAGFSEEGFLVPTTAIFTDPEGDKTYIWVIEDGGCCVFMRQVVKGKLTPQGILIVKGLEEGEWIVTTGVYSLVEGQQVRILPVAIGSNGEQIELEAVRDSL